MQVSRILVEVEREIERLQEARNLLAGVDGANRRRRQSLSSPKAPKKRAGKRKLSAEGRRKISEALKARWAERRRTAAKAA
jgi:hypothetical protein